MSVGEWTQKSLSLANHGSYLDQLFCVYPMHNNPGRSLHPKVIKYIEELYNARNFTDLVSFLLKQEIFPVKDSYVAYLRRDPQALSRNPRTLNRLAGMLYEIGLDKLIENACAPKETNRQIGPLFKHWLARNSLGCKITQNATEFINSCEDIIFLQSDAMMQQVAQQYLGYQHDKGLDFLANFHGIFIIGEAKFLSDFGGHQNAQFNDAITLLQTPLRKTALKVYKIAILDGVLYIPGKNKMHLEMLRLSGQYPIMSALLLRDYLYSL